ncbi:hypothetical protein BD779DRAFT_1491821 [Infundibulicybe gibba]|nr:hypothetical protein BD779DRAFT_1491821 [Infundibulicybe gibba]
MAPRRRCTTCGSKQWHKEPSSGLIACSEGHILQNYRNEVIEAEQAGPHTMKKRALKSGRKKRETQSKADPELYHGARGRYIYFQCAQYILRTQIAAVTKLWDLPPEFEEIVCRDVWALHLELLPNPPSAEPHDHAQENQNFENEDPSILGKAMGKNVALTPETGGRNTPSLPLLQEENSDGANGSSSSDKEDENIGEVDEEDSELAELLRENSESSSSEDGDGGGRGNVPAKGIRRNDKAKHRYESLSSTVAVLILGFWMLRIPILYRDVIMAIESYDLPYLDGMRVLPKSLVVHLTKHNIQALSPHASYHHDSSTMITADGTRFQHAPTASTLHALASRLARKMYSVYGVHTPEANAAPILWRVTQALGGSPVLYGMIKRVSHSLSLPLTIHHSLAPGLKKMKPYDPEGHRYDNVAPEVGFIAVAVIVLQMVYGLDGRLRYPSDVNDPACALAREDDYRVTLRKATFKKVEEMSEDVVDEYLGFCERALLNPLDSDDEVRHRGGSARTRDDRLRKCAATMIRESGSETGVLRPGEGCRIYNWRDVGGSAGEEYEEVVRVGARWAKVGEEYLGRVVEQLQRRLMRRGRRDVV